MFPGFVGLAAASGAAEDPDSSPPSGPPTNASAYFYSSTKVGVQWTNKDITAQTQIGLSVDVSTQPSSVYWTEGSGVTSYETGTETRCFWWVRHIKNAQTTSWVIALHPDGCVTVPGGTQPGGNPGGTGAISGGGNIGTETNIL